MASIDIHGDVGQVELLEGISDTLAIAGGRLLARLQIGICNEVRERIRFDDQRDGSVGIFLEDLDDGYV